MKKIILCLCVAIVSVLLSSPAHAIFEGRLTYGLLASNTNLDPLCPSCSASAPSMASSYGLGLDGIVTLPLPIPYIPSFGLRYESMDMTASHSGLDYKSEFTRTSLLLSWHPIDNFIFLGPILTYGIAHTTNIKGDEAGLRKADFSAGTARSYSLGVEGGIKLMDFSVGAELGYLDFRWNDSKDSTGNAPTQDINMSGTYFKILLGFSI